MIMLFLVLSLTPPGIKTTYAQPPQTRISIAMTDVSVEDVINQIEAQTNYRFLLNKERVDVTRKVTVNMRDKDIAEVLKQLFSGSDVAFSIEGDQVVLTRKASGASAQAVRISGTVQDQGGNPVIGAYVTVKNNHIGTVTNIKGRFELDVPAGTVIVVSYLGYASKEITVGSRTVFNITLEEDRKTLDEIVVVGYDKQRRATLTGAVSTVKGDELVKVPLASTTNALTGRVSGLVTVQSSGQPGSDAASLNIRNYANAPLIIVDGIIRSTFNDIDASEIESVSVLKDASAAIYGIYAGNGVIIVTTKRGNKDKPTVTFNTSFTLQRTTNMLKPLSAGDYTRYRRDTWIEGGQTASTAPFTEEAIAKYYAGDDPNYPSTNWYDYIMREYSPQQQYNVSLRGGSDKVNYYGFVGYLNQETMIKRGGGNYGRFNVRSNIDVKIIDNLKMSLDLAYVREERRFPFFSLAANENNSNVWLHLIQTMPIYPTSLPDASKLPYAGLSSTGGAHISTNRDISGSSDRFDDNLAITGSLNYDFKRIKGLSAFGTINVTQNFRNQKQFRKMFETWSYVYGSNPNSGVYTQHAGLGAPVLSQSSRKDFALTTQAGLTYDASFGTKHKLKVMALYETKQDSWETLSGYRQEYITDILPYLDYGDVENQRAGGSAYEWGMASWIGRLNYSYAEKYLLEATLRYDGSAQFHPDYRWGAFPGFTAGWRISEENFIKDNVAWLTNLKLRGGYAQMGYDKIQYAGSSIVFPHYEGYEYGNGYVFGEKTMPSFLSRGMANEALGWEVMKLSNVGFDFSMFRDKLYGEADMFYRLRDGIIATRAGEIPDTFGVSKEDFPYQNLHAISTRGFEFSLGYRGNAGGFRYNVNGNISWSRSRYEKWTETNWTDPDDIRINKLTGAWTDRVMGYVSDGLFTSNKEIYELGYEYSEITNGNASLKKGDIRIVDINGDGYINWRDKQELGKGYTPNWMYGFNMDFGWKGISLSMLWQGAWGYVKNVSGVADANEVCFNNRWQDKVNEDPYALIPRLGSAASKYLSTSDYLIRPSDYLRLKNLNLSYSFPQKWISKAKIQELKVFFAGSNLLTFSEMNKYHIDPEAPTGKPMLYYPQMKTFSFGISLTL